jgi:putative ABC transport system substrate-binding protein
MMTRRKFLASVGLGAAAAWPLAAAAQLAQRVRKIGALIAGSGNEPVSQAYLNAFREGLAGLGWIEGQNLRIDARFADGGIDLIRSAAADLVRQAPEVIFVSSGQATAAVQQETRSIPIVFAGPSDVNYVRSVARPEGNLTGFPILYPSVGGKWPQLLKEAAPHIVRFALVFAPPSTGANNSYLPFVEDAASALLVKMTMVPFVDAADELVRAIDAFAVGPAGGLIVLPNSFTSARASRELVRKLALQHRLPVIHWDKSYPIEGGLMSYGSDFAELHRLAASYVDRLLRGAKVRDLPVQVPTKFDLVINLRAAREIGLVIPEALLLRADQLIE